MVCFKHRGYTLALAYSQSFSQAAGAMAKTAQSWYQKTAGLVYNSVTNLIGTYNGQSDTKDARAYSTATQNEGPFFSTGPSIQYAHADSKGEQQTAEPHSLDDIASAAGELTIPELKSTHHSNEQHPSSELHHELSHGTRTIPQTGYLALNIYHPKESAMIENEAKHKAKGVEELVSDLPEPKEQLSGPVLARALIPENNAMQRPQIKNVYEVLEHVQ